MKYKSITEGRFISRPNRFIATVDTGGEIHSCHVKNTGRCKELLVPDCTVYLEESGNPKRKTKYSIVAVKKNGRLINMDSQAPNKAAEEWLLSGGLGFTPDMLRREYTHGDSRFDFYIEYNKRKILLEVKGVTLEENNAVYFPDAPTLRGVKHINGLCSSIEDGFEGIILFVIQLSDVLWFSPNEKTHPEFAEALRAADKKGVRILAMDCVVTPDSMKINLPVEVKL